MRVTTAIAALFAATLLTGCGGGEEESVDSTAAAGQAGESKAPEAALTGDQLSALLLATGDVDDWQFVEVPVNGGSVVDTKPAACQPVHDIQNVVKPDPVDSEGVNAQIGDGSPAAHADITIGLYSFEQVDAEKVFTELSTALKNCAEYEVGGSGVTVESLDAPDGGDEAVAFRTTDNRLSQPYPITTTVVRKGALLVRFHTVGVTTHEAVDVPEELVTAQLGKLK